MANYRKEKSLHRVVAQQQRQNQCRRQDACFDGRNSSSGTRFRGCASGRIRIAEASTHFSGNQALTRLLRFSFREDRYERAPAI